MFSSRLLCNSRRNCFSNIIINHSHRQKLLYLRNNVIFQLISAKNINALKETRSHSGRGYSRIVRSESSCSYSVNEYHPMANWFILLYNDIHPSSHTSQISQCNHDSPSLRFSAIVSAKKHRNKNQARTEEIWERTASGSDHCVLIFETK